MKKIFILSLLFLSLPGMATETVVTDFTNTCGDYKILNAVFERDDVTCASGYYLPANTRTCAACPNGATCNGGTFTFNANRNQGILGTVMVSDFTNTCGNYQILNAIFEVAQITCTSGQYLPKNTTACVACPNGYTCSGGTYSFNENTDQGIVANTITVIWNGATAEDVAANNAGTVTYGGDIRTPVRPDPSQIPIGKRFVGWTFRKTNN